MQTFTYLGINFNSKTVLKNAYKPILTKANQALQALWHTLSSLKINNLHNKIKLFNTTVTSIINYAAPTWHPHTTKEIDSFQTNFYRKLYKLNFDTHKAMIYREFNTMPLHLTIIFNTIKFWLKILKQPSNTLIHQALLMDINNTNTNKLSWSYHMKKLMAEIGFASTWDQQSSTILHTNMKKIFTRLIDTQKQADTSKIETSQRYIHYKSLNLPNEAPSYTSQNLPFTIEKFIAQLRFHRIPTEYKNSRINLLSLNSCPICHKSLPNQLSIHHLLFTCPLLEEIYPPTNLNTQTMTTLKNEDTFTELLVNPLPKTIFALFNWTNSKLKLFLDILDEHINKPPITSPNNPINVITLIPPSGT